MDTDHCKSIFDLNILYIQKARTWIQFETICKFRIGYKWVEFWFDSPIHPVTKQRWSQGTCLVLVAGSTHSHDLLLMEPRRAPIRTPSTEQVRPHVPVRCHPKLPITKAFFGLKRIWLTVGLRTDHGFGWGWILDYWRNGLIKQQHFFLMELGEWKFKFYCLWIIFNILWIKRGLGLSEQLFFKMKIDT